MKEDLPPDLPPQEVPSQPMDELSEGSAVDDDEGDLPTEEVKDEPREEIVFAEDSPLSGGDDRPVEEAVDRQEKILDGGARQEGLSQFEEVSLFVTPVAADPSRASDTESGWRGMGWKMMAVAGIVLLVAGFGVGLFFPDSLTGDPVSSEEVAVTTTTESPSTTTESPSTTTESPSTTTESPSTATEAPSTTTATTQTKSEPVPPPDLVVTDEPVSDVADRLVPSVVHLEITSDNIFAGGVGSGVIFDSNGFILTAAHVVESVVNGEAGLTVRLANGDRLPGEVVGSDPDSDVAVVQVERSGLIAAELALDAAPRVGQLVVAVGSPWGLESSVTSGVISATDRIVEGRLLVQSDAVLYPGNSGGALADRYGRLIGINVSIFTNSTSFESVEFQGVGFAVPIDLAYRVAQALIAGEPVHTAFLGVSGRDTEGDAGVEIMEVFPGSGAESAGIMTGDVIVAVGGRPVTGIADLAARIRHFKPGDVLELNILREGEEIVLRATLLPRSEVLPDQPDEGPPVEEGSSEEEPEDN